MFREVPLFACFLFLATNAPPAAHAQLEAPSLPHDIGLIPAESAATADEGHGYLFNPAGPAFTEPSSFEFYQTVVPSDTHRGPGDGGRGVFWSLPNSRFGLQYLMLESGEGTGILSFSNSRLVGTHFAYGTTLNYHWYMNTPSLLPGTFSLDVGFMARPTSSVSIGLTFDSLLSPESPIDELRTVGHFGVAVRPFGQRLTISADAESQLITFLDTPTASFLGTLRLEAVPGLLINGTVKVNDISLTTLKSATGSAAELVASLGLTFYLGKVGLGDTNYFFMSDSGTEYSANTVAFGGHGKRHVSVLRRHGGRGEIWQVTLRESLRAPRYDNALGSRPDDFPLLFQVRRLRSALENPWVKAVLLTIEDHRGGFADIQEIRRLVMRLREAGKPVFAYLVSSTAKDIYLASACSHVVIHPASEVRLAPPHQKKFYVRGVLKKLGLEAEVLRREAYKSAPEQLVSEAPSEQTAEMAQWVVRDLYSQLVKGIAEGRGISTNQVEGWFETKVYTAAGAVQADIADESAYPDDMTQIAAAQLGHRYPIIVDNKSYDMLRTEWGPRYKVGLVYLGGMILRGSRSVEANLLPGGAVYSDDVARELKRLSKDPSVKAIVIRVNSPGGDFFASDVIRHAIERAHQKVPVVVSMGNVAGSGGYYVSLPADVILADPATLTGSIGIFATRWNAKTLLEDLGVDVVTFYPEGAPPPLSDWSRPWTDAERERASQCLNEEYQMFLKQVSSARGLSMPETRAVAGGRVWTGRQALERRLVDQLGGLDDAIRLAEERAGIYGQASTVLAIWPSHSLRETILDNMFGERPSTTTLGQRLLQKGLFGWHLLEPPAASGAMPHENSPRD